METFIISRTPFRVSLFGGGSDFPAWYLKHGGAVISTAIDKYAYLTVRYLPPYFDHKYNISYREIETPNKIDDIRHPAIKESLKFLDIEKGVEIHYAGDVPARSGLGTSSSFTVGLVNALEKLKGNKINKKDLADNAIFIEQQMIKESVGSQDQVIAAYGGFRRIDFYQTGDIQIRRVDNCKWLNKYLMLFFTGFQRVASDIEKEKIAAIEDKSNVINAMISLVPDAEMAIQKEDFKGFGILLNYNWTLKKQLSNKVSTDYIDFLYDRAMQNGAVGGKICGAGNGGFLLLAVEPDNQQRVKQALSSLFCVPFNFEESGSEIIYGG